VLNLFAIQPDHDQGLMHEDQSLPELSASIFTHLDPILTIFYSRNSLKSNTGPSLQASFQPCRTLTAQIPHSASAPQGIAVWTSTWL
jgi:hypothetical protein